MQPSLFLSLHLPLTQLVCTPFFKIFFPLRKPPFLIPSSQSPSSSLAERWFAFFLLDIRELEALGYAIEQRFPFLAFGFRFVFQEIPRVFFSPSALPSFFLLSYPSASSSLALKSLDSFYNRQRSSSLFAVVNVPCCRKCLHSCFQISVLVFPRASFFLIFIFTLLPLNPFMYRLLQSIFRLRMNRVTYGIIHKSYNQYTTYQLIHS